MVSFKEGIRLAVQSLWMPLKYKKLLLFILPFAFLNFILLFLKSPTAFFRVKQNLYPFTLRLPEKAFSSLNRIFQDLDNVYQNPFMEFIKLYRFIFIFILTLLLAMLSLYFVYVVYQSIMKQKISFAGKVPLIILWIFLPVLWAGGVLVELDFFKHLQLISFFYSLGTPIMLGKGYSIVSFLNAFFDTIKNAFKGYLGGWLLFGTLSLVLFLSIIYGFGVPPMPLIGYYPAIISVFLLVVITYVTLSGLLFSVLMYEKSKALK